MGVAGVYDIEDAKSKTRGAIRCVASNIFPSLTDTITWAQRTEGVSLSVGELVKLENRRATKDILSKASNVLKGALPRMAAIRLASMTKAVQGFYRVAENYREKNGSKQFDPSELYNKHGVLRTGRFARRIFSVIGIDELLRECGILSLRETLDFLSFVSTMTAYLARIRETCFKLNSADPLLRIWNDVCRDKRDRSEIQDLDIDESLDLFDNKLSVGKEVNTANLKSTVKEILRNLDSSNSLAPFVSPSSTRPRGNRGEERDRKPATIKPKGPPGNCPDWLRGGLQRPKLQKSPH